MGRDRRGRSSLFCVPKKDQRSCEASLWDALEPYLYLVKFGFQPFNDCIAFNIILWVPNSSTHSI